MVLLDLGRRLKEMGCTAYFLGRGGENPWGVEKVTAPPDNGIVIYPEITFGNRFHARRWATWMLYYPGRNGGRTDYANNSVVFCFTKSYCTGFPTPSPIATPFQFLLHIFDYRIPFFVDILSKVPESLEKNTSFYMVRKGIQYWGGSVDYSYVNRINGIQRMEGLTPETMCRLCRTMDAFYSYDLFTFYSVIATVCGCRSYILAPPSLNITFFLETAMHPTFLSLVHVVQNGAVVHTPRYNSSFGIDVLRCAEHGDLENMRHFIFQTQQWDELGLPVEQWRQRKLKKKMDLKRNEVIHDDIMFVGDFG